MTTRRPDKQGLKAWICRNCGNDPIFERDPETENPECPRCGETTRVKAKGLGPP